MRVDSGLALDGENGEALESLDGSARGGREKKRKMQRELRTERLKKKKAQKHNRASKSRGQNAAGNAMAAVGPVKSRVDSFGQLVCLSLMLTGASS